MVAPISLSGPAHASEQARSARACLLLDSNWRFYREPYPVHEEVDWGTPVTDWKWEPYYPPADGFPSDLAAIADSVLVANDPALQPASPGQDVFAGRVGFAWFVATVPACPAPDHIHFDGFDDRGTVFINGQFVGRMPTYNVGLSVTPGAAWNADAPNVLEVLVENTGGPGGLMGTVTLQSATASIPDQARVGYDDSSWRTVHLPHDYVVEGSFDPHADASHGFLPTATAWYRKTIDVPDSDRGKSIWLDFDGVYRDAMVWMNGHYLGGHESGYAGFRFDVSKYVRYGAKNVIAVHVDSTHNEGWFYEGGGIYRHVWLTVASPVHVAPDGVFVAPKVDLGGGRPSAKIFIRTELTNSTQSPQWLVLLANVARPDGSIVGVERSNVLAPAFSTITAAQSISEPSARLWSLTSPRLYTLTTEIVRHGAIVDSVSTDFGLRTIAFDANKGFLLNGNPVKLQGTCNHQDFAGVGSAMPDNLLYWRVRGLKEVGCNAYRTSHNEVAAALLDACDRLGMLVMDETRHFGDTQEAKSPPGTPATDLADLKQMVRRDRNHPSVILWSIANEEPLQTGPDGKRIGAAMKAVCDELDGTRPVTAAMNSGADPGGLAAEVDIQGFNYQIWNYDSFHAGHPEKPEFGSETASFVSTRGEYRDDSLHGYVHAYDSENPVVGWGASSEGAWSALATRPFMAGGFVWTGFDYRGEPTPYSWPDINSNFGIMDMCGFPKDVYYYYQAWWGDKPIVHILPHWNWPGREGQSIAVWVFANGDSVDLQLNGKDLGAQAMPPYGHVTWSVPYAPGTLIAKSYLKGKLIATDTVATTGQPAAIRLTEPLAGVLHANGEDVAVIDVDIVDNRGRTVPTASNNVIFSVTGAGHVDGVGNGDPSCHEPDKASRRSAFNGHCALIVQTDEGKKGAIVVTAWSGGLNPARISIPVE
jgi:beta-galactosidase